MTPSSLEYVIGLRGFCFLLNLDASFAGNQKTCLTEPTNERRNIPTYGFNFLLGKRVGDFVSGWSFLQKIFSVNFLSLKQENVLVLLSERFTFVFAHRLDVRKKKYMKFYQEGWSGEFILSQQKIWRLIKEKYWVTGYFIRGLPNLIKMWRHPKNTIRFF